MVHSTPYRNMWNAEYCIRRVVNDGYDSGCVLVYNGEIVDDNEMLKDEFLLLVQ
uniref:Uncharacterized protein n=1 Tax=Lepeophtheirus salmonis TaxID=72036 RepID=A0A0K2TP24_LEPSM